MNQWRRLHIKNTSLVLHRVHSVDTLSGILLNITEKSNRSDNILLFIDGRAG